MGNAREVLATANAKEAIGGSANTQFTAGAPQLQIDLDRNQLEALNIDFQEALTTIGATVGSQYVNEFTLGTRGYKVFLQAQGDFRDSPEDLQSLYVRSRDGKMIPLGSIATITPVTGPQIIYHYNGFRTIKIQARQAEGFSSGQAIAAMNDSLEEAALPGLEGDWIGLAQTEIAAGRLGALVFGFGIIMVFLTLSAQYESYVDPVIILFAVPLAVFGALLAQSMRGLPNDVYCQIGLVMLIGLASKNSILIVEFANQLRDQGLSITKAAMEAAQSRMRPILMTAISTLSSIFPLVIATGAGAGSRQSLGTAVFGGMFVATFLSLFVVPILYIVVKNLSGSFGSPKKDDDDDGQMAVYEREMTGTGV